MSVRVYVTGTVVEGYLVWHNMGPIDRLGEDVIARILLTEEELANFAEGSGSPILIVGTEYFLWLTNDPRPDGMVAVEYSDGRKHVMSFFEGTTGDASRLAVSAVAMPEKFCDTGVSSWYTTRATLPKGCAVQVALANKLNKMHGSVRVMQNKYGGKQGGI